MIDLCVFVLPSFCIYFEVPWADIAFCGCSLRDSEWIIWNQEVHSLLWQLFVLTRPKPAYGRQGLDWIVGPGYSFVVFSTNKTVETNQKP